MAIIVGDVRLGFVVTPDGTAYEIRAEPELVEVRAANGELVRTGLSLTPYIA